MTKQFTKFKSIITKNKTEILLLFFLFSFYIFIRSLHFPIVFNFSSEQGAFATKALTLYRSHKIELIGPPISWRYNGRYFFQGSLTYYAMMPFLVLGHWDPLVSTYLMVPFGAVMMIALFVGVRLLKGKKEAIIVSSLYTLMPFYIDYSRFFWNPTLQVLCAPLVILWMGLYRRYKKTVFLVLVSVTSGILLLFHYQFILVILGIGLYYIWRRDINLINKALFFFGFFAGFSPIIIFELRNHFYNLQTLALFLRHANTVFPKNGPGLVGIVTSYYMLCPSLFLIIFMSSHIRKIQANIIYVSIGMLCIYSFCRYFFPPRHAFGMAKDWNYQIEKKTYDIIASQKISNFNVVNLGYDTVAAVQKYFLIRDGVKGNWDDYYHNMYLFLITDKQDYMKNPAYEINTFSPNSIINKWPLNHTYTLYLLKRL